jgi:predicted RNase H-like HicB family nuclease
MATTKYESLDYYLALPWTIEITKSDDRIAPYTARIKEIPGCMTHGKTPEEALKNVPEALEGALLVTMDVGDPIPVPVDPTKYKGHVMVRIKPEKHYQLARKAQLSRRSINAIVSEAIDQALKEA